MCLCESFEGRGRGVRPAAQVLFFASSKKSTQKKDDPAVRDPSAAGAGATCDARARGLPLNSTARAKARSAQTKAASQTTKHARSDAHAAPRPVLLGTARREPEQPHGPSRCSAFLGAERSDGPYNPLLYAPGVGRLRGGMRVGARMLRGLTRRGCPNGAPWREESSAAHPANVTPQVAPTQGVGVADSSAPFFCLLFLGDQEK